MITLSGMFCDGMVLQAGKPVRVFGHGAGTVSVSFLGEIREAAAENDFWCVEFPVCQWGGPYTMTVSHDGNVQEIRDILVGEVILCAGQSNMQFHMCEETTDPAEYRDDDALRLFVPDRLETGEYFTPHDGWVRARKDNIEKWSALAYLIGRELREGGCPHVGVIACPQGASVIQSWMKASSVVGTALELPCEALHYDHHCPTYAHWNTPGCLYHSMYETLVPYAFRCVVWYQGESNTSRAESEIYAQLLETMIRDWREADLDPVLPFYIIQIADYDGRNDDDWRRVQTEQAKAEAVIPHVRTVVSRDISESDNIHPATKSKLAKRVADVILK